MMRWHNDNGTQVVDPKVDAFIDEIEQVCRKHDMSIGHEDSHGSFVVYKHFSESLAEWLRAASVTGEAL